MSNGWLFTSCMYNTILTWSLLHADKRHFGIKNKIHQNSNSDLKGCSIKPRKLKPINRKIRAYIADTDADLQNHLDHGKQLISYLLKKNYEVFNSLSIYQSI